MANQIPNLAIDARVRGPLFGNAARLQTWHATGQAKAVPAQAPVRAFGVTPLPVNCSDNKLSIALKVVSISFKVVIHSVVALVVLVIVLKMNLMMI